jgi:hypothetical protein
MIQSNKKCRRKNMDHWQDKKLVMMLKYYNPLNDVEINHPYFIKEQTML